MGGSTGCKKTCTSDDLDCYVLDDNGFVIISEKAEHAGQFFGEIDGTIMDSLVQDGIYKKVFVYNHQASCEDNESPILDSASRTSVSTYSMYNCTYIQYPWILGQVLPLYVQSVLHLILLYFPPAAFYEQYNEVC